MRRISFRAKNLNGEWVYGFYVEEERQTPKGFEKKHFIVNDGYSIIIPETVGQHTGLIDRNGSRIYEGDILLFHEEVKLVVGYEESHLACFSLLRPYDLSFFSTFGSGSFESFYSKKIGNIHDNPDFLKGGDQ